MKTNYINLSIWIFSILVFLLPSLNARADQNLNKAPIFKLENYDPSQITDSKTETTPILSKSARNFLRSKKLILPGEEIKQGNIVSKWGIHKIINYKGTDLLVMSSMLSYAGSPPELSTTIEIICFQNGKFYLFEELFEVPQQIIVAIGQWHNLNEQNQLVLPMDMYFTALSGKSAADALKVAYTRFMYSGLSAKLKGGSKEIFDPTSGRKWKLVNPQFSLRRGSTLEIEDVYAGQVDGDFEGYYNGSAGSISPWSASIREIYIGGTWKKVISAPVPVLEHDEPISGVF